LSGGNRLADIFHEVDEEVRRERLRQFWERYSLLIAVLVILFVGAIAGWRGYEYWQSQKAAEAGTQFESALGLVEAGKLQEAEEAFNKIAATGTAGYRVLSRLQAAAVLGPRDKAAAIAAFDAIAADAALDAKFRDLAAVRAGFLMVDSASLADMEKRLETASAPQRTFRFTARELLALSAFRNKDTQALKRWADLITKDAESPAGMRARVEVLLVLSGVAKG